MSNEQNGIDEKYLAWLEMQTWAWQQEQSSLVFFDSEQGPREFVRTASGWAEMNVGHDDPADDFEEISDSRLIAVLDAKEKELRPQ